MRRPEAEAFERRLSGLGRAKPNHVGSTVGVEERESVSLLACVPTGHSSLVLTTTAGRASIDYR